MALNEESCPVPEHVLGQLYRSNPLDLPERIAAIPPFVRAALAIYCARRGHLARIAQAIVATCDKDDLIDAGGDFGAMLFEQARRVPAPDRRPPLSLSRDLRKVVAQDLI